MLLQIHFHGQFGARIPLGHVCLQKHRLLSQGSKAPFQSSGWGNRCCIATLLSGLVLGGGSNRFIQVTGERMERFSALLVGTVGVIVLLVTTGPVVYELWRKWAIWLKGFRPYRR